MQQNENLQNLWQGAAGQDKLLQSYRSFHLTTQSVLIAAGAVTALVIISLDNKTKITFAYIVFIAITALAVYLLRKMKGLIQTRAEDVNHFHRRIIANEIQLPKSEQVLTAFKLYQKHLKKQNNQNIDFDAWWRDYTLTDDERATLIEKGKGHTRGFLDRNLFSAFWIVWACLHLAAMGKIWFR